MAYEGRSFYCILFVCCCLACCYTVLGQEESSSSLKCINCIYNRSSTTYNVTRRKEICVDGVVLNYAQCERFCVTYAEYNENRTEAIFVYRGCAPDASNRCVTSDWGPHCEVTCTTEACNVHNIMAITSLGFSKDTATICTTWAPSLLILTLLLTLSRQFLSNIM